MGKPRALRGLAELTSGPAFAVAVGLLHHALDTNAPLGGRRYSAGRESSRGLGRIGQWLRENF